MELLGKIRRMHVREKLSERAIAKRTGLSRNTVHKWLKTPDKVQTPKYARGKGFSKLEGFTGELEQALKADALRLSLTAVLEPLMFGVMEPQTGS